MLINIIKKKGVINIKCYYYNNSSIIEILDTGVGISEENIKRLYILFDRLGMDNSDIEGTGIGLYVTKQLISAMNGKITVSSELNKGTTFKLLFPINNKLYINNTTPNSTKSLTPNSTKSLTPNSTKSLTPGGTKIFLHPRKFFGDN
jgi:hypothetical protein